MSDDKIAVYPGSFDPTTNGHLDVIRRGADLFDRLVVAVANNPSKSPMFSRDERIAIIRELTADLDNVEVSGFEGLIVDLAKERSATAILRGVRTYSDFEYEFQMALTNRAVGGVETVFVITKASYSFVSSRLIKEVASMGGDISSFVPETVLKKVHEKLGRAS